LEKKIIDCKAVLFDLDGVLIDSSQCITRHWKNWAMKHDLDLDEIMRAAHGVRTIDTMRLVAPPGLDVEAEERQFQADEVADQVGVFAIEGAYPLLAGLPDGRWTIVTSGSLELASRRLAIAGLPAPQVMVTADDVQNGKPAPEPYLAGAKALGAAAQDCVVIEDAPAGIEAGKKAGMRVIGVAATHAKETLLQAGGDMVVRRLGELGINEKEDRLEIEIG